MTVLTLDLGTSATKAALWSAGQVVALVRVPVPTSSPAPGVVEQDPDDWWGSVVDACQLLRREDRDGFGAVDTVACSAARETFACFDEALQPVSRGLVWSDSRAVDEVAALGDPGAFRHATGVVAGPGCCAAKIAWVRSHWASAYGRAAWLLAPRDFVAARLTGVVRTERSLASRTGLYTLDGRYRGDADLAGRLPPWAPSTAVEPVRAGSGAGVPGGAGLLLGGGDRACEVLGLGAGRDRPSVSWGTTANVSVPHPGPVDALPSVAQVSAAPDDGFVVEAGVSAAGAAIEWLGRLTGRSPEELRDAAAAAPVGSAGLLALPWLHGARAPWWRPEVGAAFLGVRAAHGVPELARAVVEGVALDVARSVELVAGGADELLLAGAGAADPLWRQVLAGVTGRGLVRRTLDDAASAGARLLAARAREEPLTVDDVNPVVDRETPAGGLVDAYRAVRARADRAAAALLDDPPR